MRVRKTPLLSPSNSTPIWILMDYRDGILVARSKGFRVSGTLGILAMAAAHGLLSLAEAFDRIKRTSFYYRQEVMDQFLADASRTEQ